MNGYTATTINIDPLLPLPLIALLAAVYVLLFMALAIRGKRRLWLRSAVVAGFILVLLNPVSVIETRKGERNDVLVVVDETQSQSNAPRPEQTEAARQYLSNEIGRLDAMKISTLPVRHTGGVRDDAGFQETQLFGALRDALQNTDPSRLGGVVVITDGQVHDMPKNSDGGKPLTGEELVKAAGLPDGVPVHVLLTGKETEADRQIVIDDTPFYGITGQSATVKLRVVQTGPLPEGRIPVTMKINGRLAQTRPIQPNTQASFEVPVESAGHNVYEFSIPVEPGELTPLNNIKIVTINGVRDRLQVLLVSGKPNPGGRMWRDILRSDAGVDLVHFTILREPGKLDITPEEELSLIEFPIRELFETKIRNFDLIILDRYGLTYLLPPRYFDNMHDFVADGGALLIAAGPEAIETDYSIFETSLRPLLPAEPSGVMLKNTFIPQLSRLGRRHPVTSFLKDMPAPARSAQDKSPALNVAPWFRQLEMTPDPETQTLMTGTKNAPLLMLKRYKEGRVAMLGSDQLWLWARGFDKGGPDRELLKRLIHWLMKEPDLEEEGLQISVQGQAITLTKRSMSEDNISLIMRRPDGREETLLLTPKEGEAAQMTLQADQTGIYSFQDKTRLAYAVVGDLNTPEQLDLVSTFDKIAPLAEATGGFMGRLEGGRMPDIRVRAKASDALSGRGWMALRDRQSYTVTGTRETPLIPAVPAFIVLFMGLIMAWVVESQRRRRKGA